MIVHIALALVAAVCAYMILAALAAPRIVASRAEAAATHDGRAYAAALVFICVFILVLAAERGWYS